jgi:hypothetical protein
VPGPYVTVATICEKVLQEADGVLSIIRSVDRMNITVTGPGAPTELPQGVIQPTLVVCLKSDDAMGRHPLNVRVQQPTGLMLPTQTFDVMFEGAERGVNLILQMQLEAIEGLYWFEVLLNESLLTRVPLRIVYQRIPSGG